MFLLSRILPNKLTSKQFFFIPEILESIEKAVIMSIKSVTSLLLHSDNPGDKLGLLKFRYTDADTHFHI